jgi:hypothetical protein
MGNDLDAILVSPNPVSMSHSLGHIEFEALGNVPVVLLVNGGCERA